MRAAERGHRHLLFVHQLLVDARALTVRQHLGGDVQRIGIGIAVVGDVVRDDDRRQRPRLPRTVTRFSLVCGGSFGMSRGTGRSAFGTRPKYCVTSAFACAMSKSPTIDERRVLRDVVGLVELADVVDRRGLEVRHAADRRVLVRMRGERLVVDDLVQPAVGLVVHAHPALFLHDLALVHERVLVDAERRHAIGLEP